MNNNSRVLLTGRNQITNPYLGHTGWSKGVDVVKSKNALDSIVAHSDGTVIKVVNYLDGTNEKLDKENVGYGNYVLIKHKDKVTCTLYAHLEGVKVKEGQKVKVGDVLGSMGNTGHSFGAHLHFEVRQYMAEPKIGEYMHDTTKYKWIDPTPYLNADLPFQATSNSTPTQSVVANRYKVKVGDKQVGAFTVLANAKKVADDEGGVVYDSVDNKVIYPVSKQEDYNKNMTPNRFKVKKNGVQIAAYTTYSYAINSARSIRGVVIDGTTKEVIASFE